MCSGKRYATVEHFPCNNPPPASLAFLIMFDILMQEKRRSLAYQSLGRDDLQSSRIGVAINAGLPQREYYF